MSTDSVAPPTRPDEQRLRETLEALGVPIPAGLPLAADTEPHLRELLLTGLLAREAHLLMHAKIDEGDPGAGERLRRLKAVFPHGWALPEDHMQRAGTELSFPIDRCREMRRDGTADGAVPVVASPDGNVMALTGIPDGVDAIGEGSAVEGHAHGAAIALELALTLLRLRHDPRHFPTHNAYMTTLQEKLTGLHTTLNALACARENAGLAIETHDHPEIGMSPATAERVRAAFGEGVDLGLADAFLGAALDQCESCRGANQTLVAESPATVAWVVVTACDMAAELLGSLPPEMTDLDHPGTAVPSGFRRIAAGPDERAKVDAAAGLTAAERVAALDTSVAILSGRPLG
ncbi:hypothetical protein [Actinomadura flavalba]|uniref:hypothetical protein n=1 Tax=Actinomadura flavalba TaxID=1120938 RepID=UPI0003738129|nr:hypothetical protein [Actinomadura flavalba]